MKEKEESLPKRKKVFSPLTFRNPKWFKKDETTGNSPSNSRIMNVKNLPPKQPFKSKFPKARVSSNSP